MSGTSARRTSSRNRIRLPWCEPFLFSPSSFCRYVLDFVSYESRLLLFQANTLREKDIEKARLENEKRKLDEELACIREQLGKTLSDGAQNQTMQKELEKLKGDKDRATRELLDCRKDVEAARKAAKAKEEEVRRREADLQQNREQMKLVLAERMDIKKERDELEVKVHFDSVHSSFDGFLVMTWQVQVMTLEMEVKSIQQIEERKYQVILFNILIESWLIVLAADLFLFSYLP